MGQELVVVFDELDNLGIEVVNGTEITATNDFPSQGAEPDLDLIEPRCMGRRKVKDKALVGLGQERTALSPGGYGRQRTPTQLGHCSAGHFMPMGVEIVENEVNPFGLAIIVADRRDEIREDLGRAVVGQMAIDFSGGHLQAGGQAAGPMTDVFMFDSFDASGSGRSD